MGKNGGRPRHNNSAELIQIGGPKFVTSGVVAKECDVSRPTVIKWIEMGLLESKKLPSGHNRILKTELERFKKSLGME